MCRCELANRHKVDRHPACRKDRRRWRSGQSHLTVNQAPSGFVGSNPTRRTATEKRQLYVGVFRCFATIGFEADPSAQSGGARAAGLTEENIFNVAKREKCSGGGRNPTRRTRIKTAPACCFCLRVRGRRYIFVCPEPAEGQGKNTEPRIAKNFRQEIYSCPHKKDLYRLR